MLYFFPVGGGASAPPLPLPVGAHGCGYYFILATTMNYIDVSHEKGGGRPFRLMLDPPLTTMNDIGASHMCKPCRPLHRKCLEYLHSIKSLSLPIQPKI